MEETEKYGVELEAITTPFKQQINNIVNITKKAGQEIKDSLNVKDALNFKELENRAKTYKLKIKQLTEELSSLQIKQRNDEWGGKSDTFNQEIETVKNRIEELGNSVDKLNIKKIEILGFEQTGTYIEQLEKKLYNLKTKKEELEKKSIWEVDTHEIDYLTEEIRQTNIELEYAKQHFDELEDLDFQQPINDIEEANEELSRFDMLILQIKSNFDGLGDKISKGFNKTIRNIKRLSLSLVGVHSAYFLISKAVSAYSQYDIEYTQKMKSAWASLGAFLAPLTSMLGTLMQKLVGYLNVFITALTGIDYIKKANEAYKYTKAIKEQTKALTAMDEITNISDNKDEDKDFNPFEAIQNVELDKNWVDKLTKLGKTVRKIYDNYIKPVIDKIWEFIKNMDEEDWIQLGEDLLVIATVFSLWKLDPKLAITLGIVVKLIEEIAKYTDKLNKGKETLEDFGGVVTWIGIAVAALGAFFLGLPTVIVGAIITVIGLIINNFKNLKSFIEGFYKFLDIGLVDFISNSLMIFEGLYGGLKQVFDGIIGLFKNTKNSGELIFKGLVNTLIGLLNVMLSMITASINIALKAIALPFDNILNIISKLTGKNIRMPYLPAVSIPYLDKGTAYVEQDGLAMIHKGEAVIPKKFNSQEYFSNINNNETTNALLVELIQAVEENGDKVPVFKINGKEFAKATYNDFKDEGNRLNTNTIMRRV